MKKSLISLLVGLSVGSSFAVNAAEEERWFEVEVILFERNIDPTKVIENWDQSLYPTYSKKNKDPMALFINDKNLINKNSGDTNNVQALVNDTVTAGAQPTLIDDSETLPIFGEDNSQQSLAKADINNDIIKSTHVVIDGANLKTEAKDPTLQIVPASELQLAEQFTALNDHANYNVVLHSAWRMQPKDRTQAVPIRLFAGQNYQQQYKQNGDAIYQRKSPISVGALTADSNVESDTNITGVIDLDNATSIDDGRIIDTNQVKTTPASSAQAQSSSPVWKIDGELTIYLEHYLYAKTNLFVRKEGVKVIPTTQVESSNVVSDNVATNAENVDLLALLGIHLEPKEAIQAELLKADVVAEDFEIDEVVGSEDGTQDELSNEGSALPQDKTVRFLNSYPMQQLRVIRSGEIHYLDHPMFGMLIQIRKYEQPEQPE